MKKTVLFKTRTEKGKMFRKAYDAHQVDFVMEMKTRLPRLDGLSNTITSFSSDNLVLIINKI